VRLLKPQECQSYAVGCAFLSPRVALYFFRSDRCGRRYPLVLAAGEERMADEQISTRISPLCVELVLKVWPQAQITLISL